VVDSSGWIEVFTDGPQAGRFVDVFKMDANFRGLTDDVDLIEKLA